MYPEFSGLTSELSTSTDSDVIEGIKIVEHPFSIDDVKNCKEAFFTSSTSFLTPVTQIDDTIIGDGRPGEFTKKLLLSYMNYIDERPQNELKR